MRLLLAVAGLTGVYALTLASAKPLDFAVGAALSAALVLALRPGSPSPRAHDHLDVARRIAAFPAFAAVTAWDIATGAWNVALTVLGVRPLRRSGIVAVPIGDRTPTGIAVTGLALTLSPGEVLVDVDRDREVLLVQVIDATDPDAIRAHRERRYRRHQRRVFP